MLPIIPTFPTLLPSNGPFDCLIAVVNAAVDGEGFEPSKPVATDLQSVPFDRSGTRPDLFVRVNCLQRSWRWDSNPQPADYKSAALPIELHQLDANKTFQ